MFLPVMRHIKKKRKIMYKFDMLVVYCLKVSRIRFDILYPAHATTLTEFERSSQFSTPTISSYITPNYNISFKSVAVPHSFSSCSSCLWPWADPKIRAKFEFKSCRKFQSATRSKFLRVSRNVWSLKSEAQLELERFWRSQKLLRKLFKVSESKKQLTK